mmetsp:Transcript_13112/g.38574  ORF Transcript_13112/g.38574 Transcript_13112/m.38574 type:complete len:216 (-) Transcript_13112:1290-1937(-)
MIAHVQYGQGGEVPVVGPRGVEEGALHRRQEEAPLQSRVISADLGDHLVQGRVGRKDLEGLGTLRLQGNDLPVLGLALGRDGGRRGVVALVVAAPLNRASLLGLPPLLQLVELLLPPELPAFVHLVHGVADEPFVGLCVLQQQRDLVHGRVDVEESTHLGAEAAVVDGGVVARIDIAGGGKVAAGRGRAVPPVAAAEAHGRPEVVPAETQEAVPA